RLLVVFYCIRAFHCPVPTRRSSDLGKRPESRQESAALSFHLERDVLRERGGVHRMTEGELEHHPFEVGIDGILIELGRRNRGGERRRGEFEAVALDSDRRSDEAFPIERHTVRLAHRPVLRGGEFQLTVPEPAPGPGDTGGD